MPKIQGLGELVWNITTEEIDTDLKLALHGRRLVDLPLEERVADALFLPLRSIRHRGTGHDLTFSLILTNPLSLEAVETDEIISMNDQGNLGVNFPDPSAPYGLQWLDDPSQSIYPSNVLRAVEALWDWMCERAAVFTARMMDEGTIIIQIFEFTASIADPDEFLTTLAMHIEMALNASS